VEIIWVTELKINRLLKPENRIMMAREGRAIAEHKNCLQNEPSRVATSTLNGSTEAWQAPPHATKQSSPLRTQDTRNPQITVAGAAPNGIVVVPGRPPVKPVATGAPAKPVVTGAGRVVMVGAA